MQKTSDKYSEEEAQQRFLAAVKAALNTPPKPLKSMPRKRPKTQRKLRTKKV